MKKLLTLSTGIVFMIVILITGGCQRDENAPDPKGPEKIKIKMKWVDRNGVNHLELSDGKNKVIDNLTTDVKHGDIVTWKRKWISSGIKSIDSIYATEGKNDIFKTNPSKNSHGNFELVIPESAEASKEGEKYAIKYTLKKDNSNDIVDPYLRIPEIKAEEDQ